jgi:hypothetical protein
VPPGRDVVVTDRVTGAADIAMLRLAVAVCAGLELSVACTVNLAVPTVVGVPPITPVDASKLRPAGRLPVGTDQV